MSLTAVPLVIVPLAQSLAPATRPIPGWMPKKIEGQDFIDFKCNCEMVMPLVLDLDADGTTLEVFRHPACGFEAVLQLASYASVVGTGTKTPEYPVKGPELETLAEPQRREIKKGKKK